MLRAKRESELCKEFMPLAYRIAHKYAFSRTFDDCLSWAMEGLLKAVRAHDPKRGASLKTFVITCIHQRIIDGLRVLIRNVRLRGPHFTLRREEPGLIAKEPMDTEITVLQGVRPRQARLLIRHFVDGESQRHISESEGIRSSNMSRLVRAALEEAKEELCKRSRAR